MIAARWRLLRYRANNGYARLANSKLKRVLASIGVIVFLAPSVRAGEKCPVEIKLLLSPPTTQTVIASLGFKQEAAGRVYFFDTDSLDLLMQGIIVRIRQGANNDLTVKVRLPNGIQQIGIDRLRGRFPCEIDRTQMGASTSYAIKRGYKATKVPEIGDDIYGLLNASQKDLLRRARLSIDWARVVRMADINSTQWEAAALSSFGSLALELWEWPAGRILELSAKFEPDAEESAYAELERLVKAKNLTLSASQDTKTSVVLKTFADRTSPLK